MMKTFTRILSPLCLLASTALAQPVLPTTFQVSIGAQTTQKIASINALTIDSGANQSWNLTIPLQNRATTTTVRSVAATGFSALDDAGFEINYANSSDDRFYHSVTAEGLIYKGNNMLYTGERVIGILAPSITRLKAGAAFNDVWEQSIAGNSYRGTAFQGRNFLRIRTSYNGYGTLTLNGATYSNCVLVTIRQASVDSASNTITNVVKTEQIYQLGNIWPLVSKISYSGTPSQNIYVQQQVITGVTPKSAELKAWPSPAGDVLHFGLSDLTQAHLTASDGRRFTLAVEHDKMNVSHLAPGLYMLEAQANGKAYRTRFIKE